MVVQKGMLAISMTMSRIRIIMTDQGELREIDRSRIFSNRDADGREGKE